MRKFYVILMLIGLSLIGCSTASITTMPQGKNKYTVVAISYSQSDALEEGMKKAHSICQTSGSTLKVLNTTTKYSGGTDQNLKHTISAISILATDKYVSSHDKDDYTVTIQFKCI